METVQEAVTESVQEELVWAVAWPVREVFVDNNQAFVFSSTRLMVVVLEKDQVATLDPSRQGRIFAGSEQVPLARLLGSARIETSIPWSEVIRFDFGGVTDGALHIGTVKKSHHLRLDGKSWPVAREMVVRVGRVIARNGPEVPFAGANQEVKSWGKSLMVLGILSMLLSDALDPVWGFALLVVGLAATLRPRPEYFIVFGLLVLWAGVLNGSAALLSKSAFTLIGLIQLLIAASTIKRYYDFRTTLRAMEVDTPLPPPEGFAITALVLAALVPIGVIVSLVALGIVGAAGAAGRATAMAAGLVLASLGNVGAIATGFGIAALEGGAQPRWMAVTGVAVGSLGMVATILLIVACSR